MTGTDRSNDTMLARIRKLLAEAEDPAASVQEAETYTAKASELMADYGIDRALLAAADPSLDVVGDRVVTLDRPYAAEKAQLVSQIALALGCGVVRRTRYPSGVKELSVHLFGHRSDLQLRRSCSPACCCRRCRPSPGPPSPRGITWPPTAAAGSRDSATRSVGGWRRLSGPRPSRQRIASPPTEPGVVADRPSAPAATALVVTDLVGGVGDDRDDAAPAQQPTVAA